MTVQCVDCSHFHLREAKGMAYQGFGHCGLLNSGATFLVARYDRNCAGFEPSPPIVAQDRRGWIESQRQQLREQVMRHA
ncbi:hypothetical protein [Allopusillimonas ginsengisoli]|uniref:hypothetical protein n=1 Tax=Allopusillimonas ginsengisoli TaxID=453575 RepID=UPI001021EFF4|nr:hypothetical protein [Allopusillimonas ginsengisoli]TEA79822.1 hypothetical protein ERE07_02460 [Allopusillimonas ginsengisoli]